MLAPQHPHSGLWCSQSAHAAHSTGLPLPLQTLAAAIALPTSVAVLMLLIWHIRMIAHNKTTIEHAEVGACCVYVLWLLTTSAEPWRVAWAPAPG